MKPPPFDYFRPDTLEAALQILARTENAKVLAGGQSLMAMLNLRYVFPGTLVDINDLFELAGIEIAADRVRIGAMTRQRRIELDPGILRVAPIFIDALKLVGHRQTRNRGTIGGSLCHLDPASELPALALLHDATVEVSGLGGRRRIPITEFILGFMTPNIQPDEIVTAVEFAPWSKGHGHGFHEFARRHGDFAVASAACLVERDGDGTVTRSAIVIGGIGSVPQRHAAGEAALLGTRGEPDAVGAALDLCGQLEALGDFHGGADYRHSVARSMLGKSLALALSRASGTQVSS